MNELNQATNTESTSEGQESKLVEALKFVFVKNAGLKAMAFALGFVAWFVINVF